MSYGPALIAVYADRDAFMRLVESAVRKILDKEPGQLSTVDLMERLWPRGSVPGGLAETVRQITFKALSELAKSSLSDCASPGAPKLNRFKRTIKPWIWHMSMAAPSEPAKCPHCGGIL